MIATLTGRITHTDLAHIIIDVQGVGYLVHATGKTISTLAQADKAVTILTEMVVREDAMLLYGFTRADEKQAFILLQTVQGVGAKAALSILNTLSPNELVQAIMAGDRAMVSRADGVGPKIALRIINELAQKITGLSAAAGSMPLASGGGGAGGTAPASNETSEHAVFGDALSALVNLGYSRSEAFSAISAVLNTEPDLSLSDVIAQALKTMGAAR